MPTGGLQLEEIGLAPRSVSEPDRRRSFHRVDGVQRSYSQDGMIASLSFSGLFHFAWPSQCVEFAPPLCSWPYPRRQGSSRWSCMLSRIQMVLEIHQIPCR